MTSLFIHKNVNNHPVPNISPLIYFNHDIKQLLLAVGGQFIFQVLVSGPSEEAKYHLVD